MLRNAKVGDEIYTKNGIIGVITHISPDNGHPIIVNFSGSLFSFTYEGIFASNNEPSNFDIQRLVPQKEETKASTPTPSSSVEYLSDLNVHIYHSPNGQSFQIYPQLKDKYVI